MTKKDEEELRKLLSLKRGTFAPHLKPKQEKQPGQWTIPVY